MLVDAHILIAPSGDDRICAKLSVARAAMGVNRAQPLPQRGGQRRRANRENEAMPVKLELAELGPVEASGEIGELGTTHVIGLTTAPSARAGRRLKRRGRFDTPSRYAAPRGGALIDA
jgi:hypothetical protein